MACKRKDVVYALWYRAKIVDHFIQVMFALANTVYPGDKRLLEGISKLELSHEYIELLATLMKSQNGNHLNVADKAASNLYAKLKRDVTAKIEEINSGI